MKDSILWFSEIDINDVPKVGGKNASLGEMYQKLTQKGINVPNGFALTANAYWKFLEENNLRLPLTALLKQLDTKEFSNLNEIGNKARELIRKSTFSFATQVHILSAYQTLLDKEGEHISLAVRSSATAEDLPTASFAGQQESFLNIKGEDTLLNACLECYASLFTDRAIKYRVDQGFRHMDVALSVTVQQMVRSDKASSGVIFTLEPESGFQDVVVINSAWGLGEHIVKGRVEPDEFIVFKPTLKNKKKSILSKKLGTKRETLIFNDKGYSQLATTTKSIPTEEVLQKQWTLTEAEIETLARWSVMIEKHYQLPMDIEWAKDGISNELFIVQARPETVHSQYKEASFFTYKLLEKSELLAKGCGLGNKIASGKVRILNSPDEAHKLQKGEILVTDTTDPDWDPILKKVAAVITNKGGRTSHAAIVARELGAVAVVGVGNATETVKDGQEVTVTCADGQTGYIYDGILPWEKQEIDTSKIHLPETQAMLIVGDPDKAFHLSRLPNHGVGLMRMEFIVNNAIQVHPMALVKYDNLKNENAKQQIADLTHGYKDRTQYFIEKLAESVATIAAAFYPKEVIVRMSDFKSNEYANLIGGQEFEPKEENPMLGFRGASRYYSEHYKEAFRLECEAMKKVRNEMGLTNVKLMIPFCRTIEEGQKVLDLMADYGLRRGDSGLQIYVMVELPSNVLLANEFAQLFDGFSIGTNDLTQLTLGLDRDNGLINQLFDENNRSVKTMIRQTIEAAQKNDIKVGLCGQAPSDFPKFAQYLVALGIDSISFNADALLQGIKNINQAEKKPLILSKTLSNGGTNNT